MTLLAPTLEGFFTERLMTQRQASPHTISGYRDTMRLLLCFATEQARDSRSYGQPPTWGALRQSAVRPAERGCLARVGG
jgi:site-specific recombinase XerC